MLQSYRGKAFSPFCTVAVNVASVGTSLFLVLVQTAVRATKSDTLSHFN